VPDRLAVGHLLDPTGVYAIQVALILCGLLLSLHALHRISQRTWRGRAAALASFLPMAGLALVLTLVSVWTLGIALL
jgi:hypothetical protein